MSMNQNTDQFQQQQQNYTNNQQTLNQYNSINLLNQSNLGQQQQQQQQQHFTQSLNKQQNLTGGQILDKNNDFNEPTEPNQQQQTYQNLNITNNNNNNNTNNITTNGLQQNQSISSLDTNNNVMSPPYAMNSIAVPSTPQYAPNTTGSFYRQPNHQINNNNHFQQNNTLNLDNNNQTYNLPFSPMYNNMGNDAQTVMNYPQQQLYQNEDLNVTPTNLITQTNRTNRSNRSCRIRAGGSVVRKTATTRRLIFDNEYKYLKRKRAHQILQKSKVYSILNGKNNNNEQTTTPNNNNGGTKSCYTRYNPHKFNRPEKDALRKQPNRHGKPELGSCTPASLLKLSTTRHGNVSKKLNLSPKNKNNTDQQLAQSLDRISLNFDHNNISQSIKPQTDWVVDPKDPYQLMIIDQNQNNDDVQCDVCLEYDDGEGDEIVICDLCMGAVHQSCYGGEIQHQLPAKDEPWFCARCRYIVQNSTEKAPIKCTQIRCKFCPDIEGIMKPILTSDSTGRNQKVEWAHIICVNWMPGIYWTDNTMTKVAGLTLINQQLSLNQQSDCTRCTILSQKDKHVKQKFESNPGMTVPCDWHPCKKSYHVRCSVKMNLIKDYDSMVMEYSKGGDNSQLDGDFPFVCKDHKHQASLFLRKNHDGMQQLMQRKIVAQQKRQVNLEKRKSQARSNIQSKPKKIIRKKQQKGKQLNKLNSQKSKISKIKKVATRSKLQKSQKVAPQPISKFSKSLNNNRHSPRIKAKSATQKLIQKNQQNPTSTKQGIHRKEQKSKINKLLNKKLNQVQQKQIKREKPIILPASGTAVVLNPEQELKKLSANSSLDNNNTDMLGKLNQFMKSIDGNQQFQNMLSDQNQFKALMNQMSNFQLSNNNNSNNNSNNMNMVQQDPLFFQNLAHQNLNNLNNSNNQNQQQQQQYMQQSAEQQQQLNLKKSSNQSFESGSKNSPQQNNNNGNCDVSMPVPGQILPSDTLNNQNLQSMINLNNYMPPANKNNMNGIDYNQNNTGKLYQPTTSSMGNNQFYSGTTANNGNNANQYAYHY